MQWLRCRHPDIDSGASLSVSARITARLPKLHHGFFGIDLDGDHFAVRSSTVLTRR